ATAARGQARRSGGIWTFLSAPHSLSILEAGNAEPAISFTISQHPVAPKACTSALTRTTRMAGAVQFWYASANASAKAPLMTYAFTPVPQPTLPIKGTDKLFP